MESNVRPSTCDYYNGFKKREKDGSVSIEIGGKCIHPYNDQKMCKYNLCPRR